MNILLTGHRGFIGSSLINVLRLNHTVTGIDLQSRSYFGGWYMEIRNR